LFLAVNKEPVFEDIAYKELTLPLPKKIIVPYAYKSKNTGIF
jgi:hypothetical protein